MREILFRAKTVDNIWHYGFPIVYSDGSFDFYELEDNPIVETYNEIYKETKKGTLGQYTGIEDKNGTKIFEGDIVKCGIYFEKPQIVRWNNEWGAFDPIFDANPIEAFPILSKTNDIEVIGNLYDNPELIGGAK